MTKYSTIHQHEPLPTPSAWTDEERRFAYKLEQTLDDIYRRFNRLKMIDLSEQLQDVITSNTENIASAQGSIVDIQTVIEIALTIANSGVTKADAAQAAADAAQNAADAAQATANTGVNKADAAQTTADTALNAAESAQDTANSALSGLSDKISTATFEAFKTQIQSITDGFKIRAGSGSTADYSDAGFTSSPYILTTGATVTSRSSQTATFSTATEWIAIGR